MTDDILDEVLNLEEASYQAGLEAGMIDGSAARVREVYLQGLEAGCRAGAQMGRLHGQAEYLKSRMPNLGAATQRDNSNPLDNTTSATTPLASTPLTTDASQSEASPEDVGTPTSRPRNIPDHQRFRKHLETLLRLTDTETLHMDGPGDQMALHEERMRKAMAVARIMNRLLPERYQFSVPSGGTAQHGRGLGDIEDLPISAVRR